MIEFLLALLSILGFLFTLACAFIVILAVIGLVMAFIGGIFNL